MENQRARAKTILVVEDDDLLSGYILERLHPYKPLIEIFIAENAEKALTSLTGKASSKKPDAVVLDIMMPYASAAEELGSESDPDGIETGLRLLKRLRDLEKEEKNKCPDLIPTWVSVITARNNPKTIQDISALLCDRGRIYIKPYNDIVLEWDLMSVLGIECKIPKVLLPSNYQQPQ